MEKIAVLSPPQPVCPKNLPNVFSFGAASLGPVVEEKRIVG
jgi:hypothetical protein